MRYLYLSLGLILCALPANAACLNPAGVEGQMVFNASHKVMQYCDGDTWYGMGWKNAPSTPPAGAAGHIQFNGGDGTLASDSSLIWDNTNKRLGIKTASPTADLHVLGQSRFSSYIHIGHGEMNRGYIASNMVFNGTNYSKIYTGDALAGGWKIDSSGGGYGDIHFRSITWGTNAAAITDASMPVRMAITPAGNVGIGTTTPASALHIIGAENSGTTAALTVNSGSQTMIIDGNELDSSDSMYLQHNNTRNVLLATGGGRVGIGAGMINPANALHVNGSIGATNWVGAGCEGACSSDDHAILYADGRIVITSSATKPGGGAWTATSDARLKTVDAPYERGLKDINALKTVRYHYNKDNPRGEPSNRPFIGLVAQDVQPHFPDAVTLRDDGYYDLEASAITYGLINAVQELSAKIDTLEKELTDLKSKR